ncbi:hypothetical protein [Yinghuangia sp. YIM S09857]|uniref:hypothetical protein n=1 Tax=Yinghuangia sp. YIM S09857 TaxID=3436929 RepID=UPI003F534245
MTTAPETAGTPESPAATAADAARTAALLDAGAVLSTGTASGDDVDTLTARAYLHPALPDRRIVRLVPGTLGPAEDLALDFLGLVRDGEAPEVGHVRRETLGFPAWALVNDPANGHHALALVRDIERLDRQARSKPGAAKEGFDQLGTTLGRAVPHFLPTFYEQAARIFLGHENTTYAATFFGKAREAERVHNLPVEEARLRAAFLEFAFAGALTAKALKEYAKDLSRRLEPAAAWAEFRQLCVERCAAGMPPYAGLAEDARAMIKAVGGGAEAQGAAERELLADLLPSPAIVRAPLSFWKTFAKSVAALAAEREGVRERLLDIFPTPGTGEAADIDAYWLSLLLAAGCDTLLTTPGGLEHGKAANWVTRWAKHTSRGWRVRARDATTLALVERMAPVLAAEGVAVALFTGSYRGEASPDLVDMCLANGVPLTDPAQGNSMALGPWFDDNAPGRRDLVAAGNDERYATVLRNAVGNLGTEDNGRHQTRAAEHPVLRVLLHQWLDARADELEKESGLPGAVEALGRIAVFHRVALDVNPGVVQRVRDFRVAPVLARTLRSGIFDELAWPALEEALALIGAAPPSPTPGLSAQTDNNRGNRRGGGSGGADAPVSFEVYESWPALILATATKAVVVGPEGILLDHDLRIPDKSDGWNKPKFRYVDGELLVMWWHENEAKAYWSSRPGEIFEPTGQVPGRWGGESVVVSLPHPDGGRVTGGRVLHAGDTQLPERRPVLTDGVGHWVLNWDQHPARWYEYDPASGTRGRASLPALLAAAVEGDYTAEAASLAAHQCELLPLLPGLENTPFGTDGKLLGRWVRYDRHGVTAGSPDGHTVTLTDAERSWNGQPRSIPMGGLRLPGGARPIVASVNDGINLFQDGIRLGKVPVWERGGMHAAGTVYAPGLAFWHALRPRDEAASTALRAVTDADAEALIAAATTEHEAFRAKLAELGPDQALAAREPVPLDSVGSVLPGVAHPHVAAGVAGIAWTAGDLARRLADFGRPPAVAVADPEEYRPAHGDDATLGEVTAGIADRRGYNYGVASGSWTVVNQIRGVAALLGAGAEGADDEAADEAADTTADTGTAADGAADRWTTDQVKLAAGAFDWTGAIGLVAPLLVRAASPLTSDERRAGILIIAEELSAEVFRRPGCLRRVTICAEERGPSRVGQVMRHGDRVVVITSTSGWGSDRRQHWTALDYDPSGRFGAIADLVTHDDEVVEHLGDQDRITEFLDRFRESGVPEWRTEAADAIAEATGARRAEAVLMLAGFPPLMTYGRVALAADQRQLLGLKTAETAVARDRIGSLGTGTRQRLLAALLPADPAALWSTGFDAEAGAAEWRRQIGDVVRLPDDIAAEASAAKIDDRSLEVVLNPESCTALTRTTTQRLDKDRNLVADDVSALPGTEMLRGSVRAMTWLAYRLPYGHPLRAALPRALAALRNRLADPGLLLDLGLAWTERGEPTSKALRLAEGLPEEGGADADGLVRIGEKVVLTPWYSSSEHVWVRVGALEGHEDPELMRLLALRGGADTYGAGAVATILSPEFERLVNVGVGAEDGGDADADATAAASAVGNAQDPSWSLPDLVEEVAKTHGVDPDVATLYLQLLALPDPTDRNVARWTGWKPARLKAARAALAGTDLVVTAKRARASRSMFLPGGWHEFRRSLPLETWKDSLYRVHDGGALVPGTPVTDLFEAAWQRVREGDAPGFEQLETRKARRGRRR